jgi:hypothetical protein
MTSPVQKILILLLAIAQIGFFGFLFARHEKDKIRCLNAVWEDSGDLCVSSASDGPFIVTHLVKAWEGTNKGAVAMLPTSRVIVDSRGERFDTNFIQSLTWISASGKKVEAPKYGQPVSVLYFEPKQAEMRKPGL